tara:strand:- start:541 stop:711 length:171 start_codon:yes stop_codon:yes gene_type:complete
MAKPNYTFAKRQKEIAKKKKKEEKRLKKAGVEENQPLEQEIIQPQDIQLISENEEN